VALQLARRGITRVHPLEGGVEAWRDRGFPVDPVVTPAPTAT
jgi:rhodanese-related sulfurtransferase